MSVTQPDGGGYDPAAFRAVFEHNFTYWAGFRRNAHRYTDRVALRCPLRDRVWTYGELADVVDGLAGSLAAAGVRPGDVVLYQLFNGPEFAFVYLATQRCQAIGSPANFRLAAGETAHMLDDSRPAAYIYDAEIADVARRALELAEHRPSLVAVVGTDGAVGADGDAETAPGIPFDDLLEESATPPPEPATTIYDETTRLWTSGTTGMPKGVPLNSVVEVLTAHDVIMQFPLTPEDSTLNMTPWFHRGGLYSGGPNPVFYVGGSVVPMRSFDASSCLDYVQLYGITFLIGAPTSLEMLADIQEKEPRDLSALRGIVTMGAPLSKEACLRYQRLLTPRIFNGYGTTEAFWNTLLRPDDLPDHAGSAGRACVDDDVAVVKVYEDGPACPDDFAAKDNTEVGEVIVRSPKSGYAYANRPDDEAARFRDGWLYIGDLATWDADEYVTIVGRKDEMIISGGENIYPVQVEDVLSELAGVADSAVVGVPDAKWGQLVVAYVVRRDDDLTAVECDRHCREHPMLADYKRPRAYRFVEAIPFTASGKKMHYKVAQQAAADAEAGLLERP